MIQKLDFLSAELLEQDLTQRRLCSNREVVEVVEVVVNVLEELLDDPYPSSSRDEPLPSKMKLPEGWTFHKLEFRLAKGASRQVRLMYLVNESRAFILPLWIYSHEQFVKRPADKELKYAIQDALDP